MNTMTKDRFQMEVCMQKAKKGDSEAQYALGNHYLKAEEYRNALFWFKKSARRGHGAAMNAAAEAYRVQNKIKKAEKWYKLAINAGYSAAKFNLATLYFQSDSPEAGFPLLRESVQDEYPPALVYYGDLLSNEGHPDEAETYYQSAAEAGASEAWSSQGSPEEMDGSSGQAQEYADTISDQPQTELAAEVVQKYRAAADDGNADAQYCLGVYYEQQEADVQQALYWYELAAKQDHHDALFALGNLYSASGQRQYAFELYGIAAEQGHAPSLHRLGLMLNKEQQTEEARICFEQAAEQGLAAGQFSLASLLEEENRIDEAIHWYTLAAEQGNADSQYNLAYLLLHRGERDKATHWYQLAAEQGDAMAQYNYAILLQQDHRIDEALKMYKSAARQGLEASQRYLLKNGETW